MARRMIRDFVDDMRPEFWGYFGAYDWVLMCQLFGTMADLPKGWPMLLLDIKQVAIELGNPPLPPQSSTKHNALDDAVWTRDTHLWLLAMAYDSTLGRLSP
jgi:hypothetical protein